MKRKNNWNLFGVIALIVISAFMLISCPQQTSTLAKENPRELTLNYSGRSTIYYYLNNNWYSDKECKNVVEDPTLQPPAAQTATITVNFNEGTAQATGEGYFTSGANPFTWNFVKYVKAGDESKADYFNGELKLPENGISENVTLSAEYEQTEVVRKLPVLVKEGVTFGGYQRVNETVEADTPITVTPGLIATYNAIWTTYNTLTLDIGGQQQKLYYGSDSAWYKALSDDGLLLDANKVTGENVKFNIPSAPTWTVTFKRNTPAGAIDSEISSSHESVEVHPELSLSPDTFIDKATGKVLVSSISEDKTVTGTYPPKAIGQSVTASSTNPNYEFAGWTANGEDIVDIANHQVNGNTEVFANWNNISAFKVLTIKDGDVVKEKAYFNTNDSKWYNSNITTSGEKTSVNLPEVQEKTYTLTLDYDNGSSNGNGGSVTSSFRGYGTDGNTSAVIGIDGLLSNYTIENDTVLVSIWSKEKFNKPSEQPTKDGYTFDAWYKDGSPYDFNSVVTGDITLVAHWKEKPKKLTVKDGVNEQDTAWYSSEDNKWYANENMTDEKTSVAIPQNKTYIITLDYDNNGLNETRSEEVISSFSGYGFESEVKIQADGSLSGYTIDKDTVLVSLWSEVTFNEPSEQPTKDGYTFDAWYKDGSPYDFNSVVTGDITLVAHWKEKPKKLTVKDGVNEQDTAWYSSEDNKWYANENMTDEKTSVAIPQNKTYIITLDYDNNGLNETRSEEVISSFSGYGFESEVKIQADGSLSGYTIDKDTVLVSLWSEVTFNEPSEQPTKDGYTFDAWYKDGQPYDFNSVVTGNMTLTANWTKKTYNTLTFDITGLELPVATQTLYYGSDGAWYKALGNDDLNDDLLLTKNKVTGDEVKFIIPETHAWTVTLNKNTPTNKNRPFSDDAIKLSHNNQLTLYPKDGVFSSDQYISRDGKVKVLSITENVNVTLDTSRRRPSEIVEATTPDSIKLVGWLNGDEKISDLSNYVVTSDNISLNASWGYKVSIGELAVPGVGISDVDRGFYTTTQDIDESVDEKSKQQREAYYAEGETVKVYYNKSSIMSIDITLKNEWSGETTLINPVGTYQYTYSYSLLEIASMANQPLSISFKVTDSEKV